MVERSGVWRSRWRGQPGRLEVWYTTLTDPATGTGIWVHHELVAAPSGAAHAHGWVTVFPPDAAPVLRRFGPEPWRRDADAVFAVDGVSVAPQRLSGVAGDVSWDLVGAGGSPLYTFPRWAWRKELLPAAQMVADAGATYSGTVRYQGTTVTLRDAPGATARIYGHGNARRWAWLHADLGDGDVCEIVAAVATRPLLRLLPALPMLRLRLNGVEWPATDPLLAAVRFRADIGRPRWTVRGRAGRRRVTVEVQMPADRTVSLDYADPDGSPAVCHNTERATATIRLENRHGGTWHTERTWSGIAHAEVGER